MEREEAMRVLLSNQPHGHHIMLEEAVAVALADMRAAAQAQAATADNSAMVEIALPEVGVFILCGVELGMKAHEVSKLYHAVVARLHQ